MSKIKELMKRSWGPEELSRQFWKASRAAIDYGGVQLVVFPGMGAAGLALCRSV